MSQITNIISDKGDYLILSSDLTYENVQSVTIINEIINSEQGSILKQFRWSYNNLTFSEWIDLSLININLLPFDKLSKFWIQFRYELLDDASYLDIDNVYLTVVYKNQPDISKPFSIAYPTDRGNRYWPIKLRSFTWNPYSQEKTIKLQKELSYLANQVYGHEITYFRAMPLGQSKNVTFMEYTLFNVDNNFKCLKVLVPDNTFPEHKLNHNAFGIDFELPFELHIDKKYFEEIFGDNARPQKRDIIYFPLTNRIYEVISSEIAVQFMYDFLYWHISLQKWQPKTNIMLNTEANDLLQEYHTDISEIFDNEISDLNKDITNKQQLEDRSYKFDNVVMERYDYKIDKNYKFLNYYTTVFDTVYDFTGYPIFETAVQYHLKNNVDINSDFVYTAWFNKTVFIPKTKTISSIEFIDTNIVNLTLVKDSNFSIELNNIISIKDTSVSNFSIPGKVIEINSNIITLELFSEVQELYSDIWHSSTTLFLNESYTINLLKSNNGINGIDIDIVEGNYLMLSLNSTVKLFKFSNELQVGKWYSIVVSISNIFKQISYHLYTTKDNDQKTTVLTLLSKQTLNNQIQQSYASNLNYTILFTESMLTNIRILNKVIEEEKHSKFLNLQIVKDASNCLLIDNAKPVMKLPYIGVPK